MSEHTVPAQFVQAALEAARERGLNLDEWLRRAGTDPRNLDPERGQVSLEQTVALVRELWRVTDDELFGLGAQPVPRGTFRLLSLALVHSSDLHTVLDRLHEFTQTLAGLPAFSVEVTPPLVRVGLGIEAREAEHFLADLLLAVGHRFLGWLIGHRIRLQVVELPYPRPEVDSGYQLLFGAPLEFDSAEAAFVFDSSLLALPVMQDEETLAAYTAHSPFDLLSRRDWGTAVSDKVRRVLEGGLRGQWPTPDEVAARLSMSPQNMRRLLREEGSSLTQIKEELLRDAALASLAKGDESVAALSTRLGFSEPSAFNRAFRRWTGGAPTSYRRG